MKVAEYTPFNINQGICQYNAHDYYAILGAPITADINKIRKSYLHIAKRLHPDTFNINHSSTQTHQASQYLAKLVNPAYSFLMAEKERNEYSTILKLLAKRLIKQNKQGEKILPTSELVKNFLYSSPTLTNYERAVEAIAIQQYQDLDHILEKIGQLSELNLVYILHQEGYRPEELKESSQVRNLSPVPNIPKVNKIQVCEEYIAKKQWMLAVKELREYLQTNSQNSYAQSLLGLAYLNQNLDGMAKVCFQQALKMNPHEAIALANIGKASNSQSSKASQNEVNQTPKTDRKKGGFFGWLGGG